MCPLPARVLHMPDIPDKVRLYREPGRFAPYFPGRRPRPDMETCVSYWIQQYGRKWYKPWKHWYNVRSFLIPERDMPIEEVDARALEHLKQIRGGVIDVP